MKILIEVVATNMDTGHIAINQHSMELNNFDSLPDKERQARQAELYDQIAKTEHFKPMKVGPILIDRSLLCII